MSAAILSRHNLKNAIFSEISRTPNYAVVSVCCVRHVPLRTMA